MIEEKEEKLEAAAEESAAPEDAGPAETPKETAPVIEEIKEEAAPKAVDTAEAPEENPVEDAPVEGKKRKKKLPSRKLLLM